MEANGTLLSLIIILSPIMKQETYQTTLKLRANKEQVQYSKASNKLVINVIVDGTVFFRK
jgi:hypothetical protein